LPGTIDVTGRGNGAEDTSVEVGPDGFFSVTVPVGTYSLAGRSNLINGGATPCSVRGDRNIIVRKGGTVKADVISDIL
jgi:hypothetical protein